MCTEVRLQSMTIEHAPLLHIRLVLVLLLLLNANEGKKMRRKKNSN